MIFMRPTRFSPPLSPEGVAGKNTSPDGHVNSVSLMLRDAHGKLFSLHVATEGNFILMNAESFGDDSSEPVFVVPGETIEENVIPEIVEGVVPDLLGLYLVEQSE